MGKSHQNKKLVLKTNYLYSKLILKWTNHMSYRFIVGGDGKCLYEIEEIIYPLKVIKHEAYHFIQ